MHFSVIGYSITSKSCCFGLRNAVSCSRKWLFSFPIISKSLPYWHLPPLAFHQLIGCKLPYNAVGNLWAHKNMWSTLFIIQYSEPIISLVILDLRSHYVNSLCFIFFFFFFSFCSGLSLEGNFQKWSFQMISFNVILPFLSNIHCLILPLTVCWERKF